MTPAQGILALYCQEPGCAVELEYRGYGRPPRWCDDHYPSRAPARLPLSRPAHEVPAGFSAPHARPTDPQESHDAVPSNISAQATRILRSYLSGDLLDVEAYEVAGFPPEARDGQRCSDLRKARFIERTGERRLTPNGKSANVCRITPAGREFLA